MFCFLLEVVDENRLWLGGIEQRKNCDVYTLRLMGFDSANQKFTYDRQGNFFSTFLSEFRKP